MKGKILIPMKKVGIVARSGEYYNRSIMYFFESYRLIAFKNNVLPVMILPPQEKDYFTTPGAEIGPLSEDEKAYLRAAVDECDGIIMSGGKRFYDYDRFIYSYALEKDKPILGICMGMQIMAAVDTGEKPLPDESKTHRKDGEDYAHAVSVEKGSVLHKIVGKDVLQVNSYHSYYMDSTKDLLVTARSEDGYIEAVEMPGRNFVLGVQWHPEIMYDYDDNNRRLMDYFFEVVRNS